MLHGMESYHHYTTYGRDRAGSRVGTAQRSHILPGCQIQCPLINTGLSGHGREGAEQLLHGLFAMPDLLVCGPCRTGNPQFRRVQEGVEQPRDVLLATPYAMRSGSSGPGNSHLRRVREGVE